MERKYRRLRVWQDSIALTEMIYQLTSQMPNEEKFGLVSQMRRAAVSVASNIAEGAARNSDRDFRRFLFISRGSLAELETQIEIAHRLDYIHKDSCHNEIERLFAGLASLTTTIEQSYR